MKSAFFLLACTCLISGLAASFVDSDEANFDNEVDPQLDIFFPENGDAENLIIPYPRPPSTYPPRPTTTTTTTTTRRPSTTTTTRRPTTTTRRPRPRPELERIQIYKNAVRSLGPLAGRLVNVVLNKGGRQKTTQENEILYNLRSFKGNRREFEEEN